MPMPHQYHKPDDSPAESEDDLDFDLDDLDPVSRHLQNGVGAGVGRRPAIPLKPFSASPSRLAKLSGTRAPRHERYDEDAAALLRDSHGSPVDERRRWNVRSGRRHKAPFQSPMENARPSFKSPKASFRASLQLPDFIRQELSDMQEVAEVNNQDSREVSVGQPQTKKYPTNVVSNAKYTAWSFLPHTLYNEFSFFLNTYFLLVALSQLIPYLRIGYMYTYIVPLLVVLSITIGKEAIDDIARRRRDAEANAELYTVLSFKAPEVASSGLGEGMEIQKRSRDLKVGDILRLQKDQRLPADVVLLRSAVVESLPAANDAGARVSESSASSSPTGGETFIRTDQLDGETDWKLRLPSPLSQRLALRDLQRVKITAGAPAKNINEFVGTLEFQDQLRTPYDPPLAKQEIPHGSDAPTAHADEQQATIKSVPLTVDNTAWANTVLASNTNTYAAIIYTGRQTRSAMSTSPSRSKTGLLDLEINTLTKILCVLMLTLSVVLVALEGFEPSNKKPWYVAMMIYLILFSTIIPISLRVNLDLAKSVYAYMIEHDTGIPGTVVRTSTIPEDLGRIEYLLSDKTGTLTQNEMRLKKIHVGTVSYANDAMEEVATYVSQAFGSASGKSRTLNASVEASRQAATAAPGTRTRREIGSRVRDLILALAVCHTVTPTTEDVDGERVVTYQASSPDEIAIVEFTEAMGLRLSQRDRESMQLQSVETGEVVVKVTIRDVFPFTSDSKRMGIIVEFDASTNYAPFESGLCFFQKGADTVMTSIVAANDWLDEETANMAREGLRTLVVGRKRLSAQQYAAFSSAYSDAALALQDRDAGMAAIVQRHLEHELEILGVTGVEDRLQKDVKASLELLRNAGVKIWMLTGDKVETARCVAVSARLVARGQHIHQMVKLRTKSQAQEALDVLRNKTDACLLIDGESLSLMLSSCRTDFIRLAVLLPTVIACRCSPTQKADVALLIRHHTRKRICCIGDGGNDVSMIQAADVGIGIVGKEGRQASLAADFSILQFCHLPTLLVWHGRNSYKRSAKLAQFIIHRGLIISVCQTMYNIAGHFDPKGLFVDWLLVGYATVYTMAPVFSLVLDRDVDPALATLYPELYRELKKGDTLSHRTFFTWVCVSIYQGIVIQGLSQLLADAVDGPRMLSLSYTVLILNELIMVAVSVTTWHPVMILCIVGTASLYAASVPFLGEYFDLAYMVSWAWAWRVTAVAAISLVPVWGGKVIGRAWRPPSYRKVRGT